MSITPKKELKGRKLNQAKLDILKEYTKRGFLMVADTSALMHNWEDVDRRDLSAMQKNVLYGNEARLYNALQKEIKDKEIDFYITEGVMKELTQKIDFSREENTPPILKSISTALRGLIQLLKERNRIFSPQDVTNSFYVGALQLEDVLLLDFIKAGVYNHGGIGKRISLTDAGILIALLYAFQSREKERVMGVFRDEDIRGLERGFLRSYKHRLPFYLAKYQDRLTPETKMSPHLTFLTPVQGHEDYLVEFPVKRLILPGEKNDNGGHQKLPGSLEKGLDNIEVIISYEDTFFPSSTSKA